MAAILKHIETIQNAATSQQPTVTLTASPVGYLLVAVASSKSTNTPTVDGTGWTQQMVVTNGISCRSVAWTKLIASGDSSTYTFDFTASVENIVGISVFQLAASSPFFNDCGGNSGSGTKPATRTAGGGTATDKLAFCFSADATTVSSTGSGYVTLDETTGAASNQLISFDSGDGAAQACTWNYSGTTTYAAGNITLIAAYGKAHKLGEV